MPASKIRFITGCQQLLALAVVLAALTPAASVVSLDVVQSPSEAGPTTATRGALAAYIRAATTPAKVPTEVVDPTVHEYPLTTPAGRRTVAGSVTSVVSRPEPVVGYGAVGVTWAHGAEVPTDDITLQVRTRTGDAWSGWMPIGYEPEHGPDPGSAEARHARPGTDALLVASATISGSLACPLVTRPPRSSRSFPCCRSARRTRATQRRAPSGQP